MSDLNAERLVKIDSLLDGAIKKQRESNLDTLEMIQRFMEGPEGWDAERKVYTLSILLSVAIQRLVMHEVMSGEPGELDWPEGELPGEA